ncbi:MAG: rhodanese-like domain-containing protein [Verrucomicrobiales bacterium]
MSALSPLQAQPILNQTLLLDVRSPAEFEEAHIPGSHLIPLDQFESDAVRALAKNHEHCLIICRSGNRAQQAAKKLGELDSVAILDGGILAWEAAGLPLNRGQKTMSLERQVRIAAGALVVTGVLLATLVNPWWMALSGFVGAGLVFAGITDTCGMGMLIARMPWNQRQAACCTIRPDAKA